MNQGFFQQYCALFAKVLIRASFDVIDKRNSVCVSTGRKNESPRIPSAELLRLPF